MPLYEYQCKKCGERFELIQKFSAPPRSKCPKCKASAERLLSAPAIQFKGSGWYVTDYANKSAPSADHTAESSNGSGEKAKGTGKNDSKPADKKKSKKPVTGKS